MSTVTITISSGGTVMDPSYQVLSVDVVKEVNRIPYAQIVLLDGDAAEQKFAISDETFFEPGKEIEIKLRYENDTIGDVSVFKGLVVRHAVEANEKGMLLTVEMKDAAIKMTQSRRSEVYKKDLTDDKIIGDLITKAGLTKGKLATMQAPNPELVQYYSTDWDFMLSRADVYGMAVVAEDGTISISEMKLSGQPKHTFEFGITPIYNFEIEVDGNHQYADVQSIAWDVKNQKLTAATKAKAFTLSQGNVKAATVADAVGGKLQLLSDPVSLDPKELQAWADGAMIKSRMAMIRGRISTPGTGDIHPMEVMEVAGVGKRFNGKTLITGVRHQVDVSGWQTDVQFGLSAERFASQRDIIDPPAAGQLPGVNGLQIGVVDKFEEDPDKEFRVKVILPGIDETKGAVWARLASPQAGKERGYFFRPETGDEVVVGFFNDDPRQAVILGAMFGSKNTPPKDLSTLTKDNIDKGIVTKTGSIIHFIDDKKAAILIATPKLNKVLLDDDNEMVEITDQHGNAITMNKDGIQIKSVKDLKIDGSKGNVEIKAKALTINASGKVEIKGSAVDVK